MNRGGWVDEVRSRARILDIAGQYTKVGSAGVGFRGPCPLHGGKSPNFAVYPERNTYKCYVCDGGGDPFSLVMEMEGLDFIGAAKHLAAQLGVDIPAYRPREWTPEEKQRLKVQEVFAPAEAAQRPFWEMLGLESLSSTWALGAVAGEGRVPLFEHPGVPLGWLRYRVEADGEEVHPVPLGLAPESDPEAGRMLFHHPSLSSYLRKDPLVVVDDACAVLELARQGYMAALALPPEREAGRWLDEVQADRIAELGARIVAFLIPMGEEPRTRRERMKALFQVEPLLLERGIEPWFVSVAEAEAEEMSLSGVSDSWSAVRRFGSAEALRERLRSNRYTCDVFQIRVQQVCAALRRPGGLSRQEALAKLRPSIEGARKSGDRVLYHAYLAWAARAVGERERGRFLRELSRAE